MSGAAVPWGHVRATRMAASCNLGFVLCDVDLPCPTGQFLRRDRVYVPKAGRDGFSERGVEVAPGLPTLSRRSEMLAHRFLLAHCAARHDEECAR